MPAWMKRSVAAKILVPVLGLILVVLGGMGLHLTATSRKETMTLLSEMADKMTMALRASVREDMMTGNMDGVKGMLHVMGREENVKRMFLTDAAGRIKYASDDSLVGQSVPEAARAAESQYEETRARQGGTAILHIEPLAKEARCAACHEKAGRNIGYIGLDYDVTGAVRGLDRQSREYWLVIAGIIAALSALIALLINALVARPLVEILGRVQRASEGDLTADEAKVRSVDEMGRLTEGFNVLVRNLRQLVGKIVDRSLALKQSADGLTSGSVTMSRAAEETSSQASAVSAAGEQVSKSSQTVASGVEEMSSSIKEIARNSTAAAKVAGDAVKAAQQTSAAMAALGESSAEIGKVVKLITAIAGQTNLLALNASIEAAAAGEAGRGFAVVAKEVKDLAKEAAKASEEISRKIDGIQDGAKGAIDAIARIGTIIGQISDISNSIAGAIEEQTATTGEISRNIAQVAQGSAQIAQNISGMAQAAQSTAKGATDTQKSAADLAHLAAELRELVARFKL